MFLFFGKIRGERRAERDFDASCGHPCLIIIYYYMIIIYRTPNTLHSRLAVLLAVSIPRLELFISLFGALCLSVLGIGFPALIEICVLWPERDFGPLNYVLWKDIMLIIIGILAMVLGTYISVQDIVRSFN